MLTLCLLPYRAAGLPEKWAKRKAWLPEKGMSEQPAGNGQWKPAPTFHHPATGRARTRQAVPVASRCAAAVSGATNFYPEGTEKWLFRPVKKSKLHL
ncbi:hypothetical protein [Hymenobacter rubidus]|uniref:hypothetical protein n=1 Tax=Hymenobacter rubidus TaxID=1441626 RepID=UPI00191FFD24|nr:hypothetical protein [Hymenobacter rubidus]